jgi:hypothetical protein
MPAMSTSPHRLTALSIFLRVYGILSLLIFAPLFAGFMISSPLLAESGGFFNWTIWNDVTCGAQPCHVPPMLFTIYIVWAVFLLLASRNPLQYTSFLAFTMWANLLHGLLMAGQALTMPAHYWSKWLTDIPFILVLALGIYWLRPSQATEHAPS